MHPAFAWEDSVETLPQNVVRKSWKDTHFGIAEYTQDISHFHFCDRYPGTLSEYQNNKTGMFFKAEIMEVITVKTPE